MTTDENRIDSAINKVEIEFSPSWYNNNSSPERNNFLLANRHGNSDEIGAIVEFANKLVNETIMRAIGKIAMDFSGRRRSIRNENEEWPMSEKMTATTGLKAIERMMKNWKLEPALRGWKYYAEFIGLESDESFDFYSYQVRWSYPTYAYPEPQVIVNVYFTLEATKLMDKSNDPVDVKYVFEGNKFEHRSNIKFRPKWIYDVLDIKTIVFKSLKF